MPLPRIALPLLVGVALLHVNATTQAAPSYVTAIWKVQSLDFAYHGTTTAYSCSTLQRRLETILRSLGARDTLSVVMQRCTDQADAQMRITLASPVEASEANIEVATKYDGTDALIAKVRNETLATAENVERFPATWKIVAMSRDKALKLESGDCELVKQLRRDVFPRLAIRIVRDNLRCSMAFPSLGQPQLTVAALVAAPPTN